MQFPPPNLHDLRQAGFGESSGANNGQEQGRRSFHGRRRNVSMQTEGTEASTIVSKQQDTRGTKLTKFKCSAKVWKPISGVPDPICRSDAREVQVYSLDPMLGEALMGTTN